MALRFIDLFAGIGGFHTALAKFGAECVFASEWEKHASQTYQANFGIKPAGDITKIDEKDIPPHDVLCAGFPCQAFSISGNQQGFNDTRGTLFFEIARIIQYHQPKILLLENVKNFAKHDNGNTLKVVKNTLEHLGYRVFYQILNASDFGLPQNRERIYFVGFHKSLGIDEFQFPISTHKAVSLTDFLEKNPIAKIVQRADMQITKAFEAKTDEFGKVILPNRPIQIGKVGKGGQGERIYHPLGHAITLSAYGGGVGSKTGLYKVGDVVRKLSTRECARILGFSDDFKIVSSQAQAYQQFGNSVAINVLTAIFQEIQKLLGNTMKGTDFTAKQLKGSQTAKGGFQNEHDIVAKFNHFSQDEEASVWLTIMGYEVAKIDKLIAIQIPTRLSRSSSDKLGISEEQFAFTQKFKKADIQIQLTIAMEGVIYRENISLKKANATANFNQIDKRSVDTYQAMWGFNDEIATTLKKFTGVIVPTAEEQAGLRDKRRWYLNELPPAEVANLLDFLNANKVLIFSDILKGRGMLSAEWFLVTKLNGDNTTDWVLKNINEVVNFYAQGDIGVSNQGGLILGRLTAQRKGGTPDPTSLQFKIKPLDLFEV